MRPLRISLALMTFVVSSLQAGDFTHSVQETYQKLGQFQADFVQKTHIELLDKEVEEKGTMAFAKPGKFLISYVGKNERRYICNGKTLWIYHPKDREVEIYPNVADILTHEALSFLGGLGKMTEEFRVQAEPVQAGPGSWLTLAPRKRSPFRKIRLKIDPVSFWVTEIVLFPKEGNESHYFLSSLRTTIDKRESFEFVPPEGTEVTTLP